MVAMTVLPAAGGPFAVEPATVRSGGPRSSPLRDGGTSVAALLAAGFALRAIGHLAAASDPDWRQAVASTGTILYCLGFGYALLGLSSMRRSGALHFGAICLCAGSLLQPLLGATQFGLALIAAGGALLMLALGNAARRSMDSVYRLAGFVAATGPALFALHAVAFTGSDEVLAARFLRLGATAAMALPLLAMLYRTAHAGDSTRPARIARTLFTVGMVAMPVALVLSSLVDQRVKYALGPASDCFTIGLMIACFQAWRRADRAALTGFGIVLASMLLGKLMGIYAFDGPFAAPAALAAYADAWRVALRHFHIDLMVMGFAVLVWPALVRPRVAGAGALALGLGLLSAGLGRWSALAGVAAVGWLITFWRGRAGA